jgi:hypothetical protein
VASPSAIYFFFGCWSKASVFSVVVIRIVITAIVVAGGAPSHGLTFAIDVTQVLTLVMSLATNMLATGIIGAKAWLVDSLPSSFQLCLSAD